jgi:hypothetical protein
LVTAANSSSGGTPRHQRRDPPQRGLLLGQQPQLLKAQRRFPSPLTIARRAYRMVDHQGRQDSNLQPPVLEA